MSTYTPECTDCTNLITAGLPVPMPLIYECVECGEKVSDVFECEGDDYCQECKSELVQCYDCDNYFKEIHHCIDGDNICESCIEDYYLCDDCEEYFTESDINIINSGVSRNGNNTHYYCENCISDHFTKCCGCDTYTDNDDTYYSECAGESYCSDCYYERYSTCEGCDCEYSQDDLYSGCCSDCSDHEGDYEVDFTHNRLPDEPNEKLLLGFEIEMDGPGENPWDYAEAIHNINDQTLFNVGEEPCCDNGFEVKSHPASWRWIQKHKKDFDPVFDLRNKGWISHSARNCGMHVHINKAAFSSWHILKFLRFYYSHPELILLVSQRTANRLQEWAKVGHEESTKSETVKKARGGYSSQRYSAVNMTNSKTIEIRIFRGNLRPERVFKNLEFVHASFMYSKDASKTEVEDNSNKHFMDFVREHRDDYPNLYKFLYERMPLGKIALKQDGFGEKLNNLKKIVSTDYENYYDKLYNYEVV